MVRGFPLLNRLNGMLLVPAFALLLGAAPSSAQEPDMEGFVANHAIPISSIDLEHGSMDDLEPLVELIGDARVVALGEGSHGAGSDFRAKARLIRFLHERMGFDVILWEAGIYDMRYLSADQALYAHWAHAEEVRSLLAYLEEERATGRPMEMAGFDLQISSPFHSTARLIDGLLRFFTAGDQSMLSPELAERLDRLRSDAEEAAAFAARVREAGPASDRFAPTYRELAALAADLLHAIDRSENELKHRRSPRQTALVRQMLKSLVGLDRIHEPLPGEPDRPRWDFVRRWNEREIVNAANIDWYVHSRYPDRRIIIWAHNAHIAEGFLTPDFSTFSVTAPAELPIRPSGTLIRMALGSDLFSIIFTAYEGSVRQVQDALALTSDTARLEPAPEESLEGRLHAAGFQYAILPLGAAGGSLSTWLNTPRVGRIGTEFLAPQSLPWKRVADAMFFVDQVEPSTLRSAEGTR